MIQVLITVAEEPTKSYPFAVVVVTDGVRGQETLCKTMRDCRIYANGLCAGGRMFNNDFPVNPTVDDTLEF